MPTIPVDGCDLYYEEHGSGPGLLFIHGLVTDAGTWEDQVGRLASSFRCVTYDRRGSSRSTLGNPVSPDLVQHARDAAELIRALALERCVLVASSLGGVIGLELMRFFPGLVRGAVLSEPAAFYLVPADGEELVARTAEVVSRAFDAAGPEAAVEGFALHMDPAAWDLTEEPERARMRANYRALFEAMKSPPYKIDAGEIATISVPTVVICGDMSPKAFQVAAQRLAELIRCVTLVRAAGSGHLVYVHQPEFFASTISEFAERLS
jgi:pimeloyl-ACP methyl ester carboxylesterase